jgi:hypothetical protein
MQTILATINDINTSPHAHTALSDGHVARASTTVPPQEEERNCSSRSAVRDPMIAKNAAKKHMQE